MKPFLALLLIFLAGCKTVEGIKVETFDDATRFRLVNRSGLDLHNVKATGSLTYQFVQANPWMELSPLAMPPTWKRIEVKAPEWGNGAIYADDRIWTNRIRSIHLRGRADEGRWEAKITVDTKSPPR